MYKFKKKIMFCLCKVILGFIPRIHQKHTMSSHYRACPEDLDTRDKPEYDRNKGLSTGIFEYTLNVILGFIPRIYLKHSLLDSRDKPENGNCVAQCGRSMIEMLGVLAIIGVLSVGGIAGYSKAIREYKSNQQKLSLSQLFNVIISLRPSLGDYPKSYDNITEVLFALNEIPEGYVYKNAYLQDNAGNKLYLFFGLDTWENQDGSLSSQNYYLLTIKHSMSEAFLTPSGVDFCKNALQTVKAYRSEIKGICFHVSAGSRGQCFSYNALDDAISSPVKITETCVYCNESDDNNCNLNVIFDK